MYVDAHVHLGRYPESASVLRDVESERIVCVSVTDTPSEYREDAPRLRRAGLVEVALGVHPLRAGELGDEELSLFDDLVAGCAWVGEVGLDGSPDGRPTLPAQRRAFERVLGHPATRGRVLTVHSRGAETEVVAALVRARVSAVLHWYRGSLEDAEAAVEAGLHFSVNPAMVCSASGRRLLAALPPDRVLTETDGPYTSVGRRPSAPRDVGLVLAALAQQWQVDVEAAARRVWANLAALRSPWVPSPAGPG